jgi:hypothetical protein
VADVRFWRVGAWLVIGLFLASIARFYHPQFGFTGLIAFPAGSAGEHPSLRQVPHAVYPASNTYDGQFYAQLALEPLLRDPVIDQALDQPPYRARRILFSWTAYVIGLGRPFWVLNVYALQNVFCWLMLAWLLTRWFPIVGGRQLALWTACLCSHGLLSSVQFALLDGPSVLLLACAAAAAESGRPWTSAAIVGAAGLGRETNVLGASMIEPPRNLKGVLAAGAALVLAVLPLLLWQDYLWSVYRTWSYAGGDQIAGPFVGYGRSLRHGIEALRQGGPSLLAASPLLVLVSLTVQAVYLLSHPDWRSPWWRLALMFATLMAVADPVVWLGFPGAVSRVGLPLTVGFNVLLARKRTRFWPWFVLGNLHAVLAPTML